MRKIKWLWQFLCDSGYDLLHLHDTYGQDNLAGWWDTRKYEFHRQFGEMP